MSEQEQVLFASINNCCYFKLCGELRYTNATGMDDLIERLFSTRIECAQVVIDLNQATFIDSTYVGLLAGLARYCQQQQLPKPTLFSTQSEINELLFGLCLDQAFQIIQQPTTVPPDNLPGGTLPENTTDIATQSYSEQQQGRMILRAHEALIALNDKNKAEFQPVVNLLKQQLK
ncbi:anti-anti-sigma factor [Arsukibacterium tuosuense]|uniref:Anti-anti-sigma factor n=1 Tax=Arsukibacterium tuosuense TaxID=1323745 RepID=A0A285IUL4_9GAMM|nr:STAS domain-containing protein [Arsukibacterium tuosuense]SNY51387.1 anti-anti-sigma factor [Arsukibacterium tuosuense]